jgi:PhnB protein
MVKQVFTPYLSLKNAKEAIDFYIKTFNGKILEIHYGDTMPGHENKPESKNLVAHSEIEILGAILLVSDIVEDQYKVTIGNNVQISIEFENTDIQKQVYESFVANDSNITMELKETPWGDVFAMLSDKYGAYWMLKYKIQQ